jgi:hypothetical protein
MTAKIGQKCPLFPGNECPRGKKESEACRVRINGDFDPLLYFKDLLLLHCALNAGRQQKEVKARTR